MEQLIAEIERYAAACGVKPGTVLKRAGGYGGRAFAEMKAGKRAITLPMADRIREYMAKNPPPKSSDESLACPVDTPEMVANVKGAA